MHVVLEKKTSYNLKNEFRSTARRFLEDFARTMVSTVAAHFMLGLVVSCFCPEKNIWGDDYSALFFLGHLLDNLIACGWEKGSTMEAGKAEFRLL